MRGRALSRRFGREVDGLCHREGQAGPETLPREYAEAMELVRLLYGTDLSPESRVRYALRRRLLNRVGTKNERRLQREVRMSVRGFFRRYGAALALVTVAVIALFVVAWARPGSLTAAAQAIETLAQDLLWVGPHTAAKQVSPEWAAAHPQKAAPARPEVGQIGDDTWIIRTAAGNFGGNVLPDQGASVQRFSTFEAAQAVATFRLHRPRALPASYLFREAMVAPTGMAFLFYEGPGGEVLLAQQWVGQTSPNVATMVGWLTDEPIQEVMLNGQPAGWIEGEGLLWEADGVTYMLAGRGLTLQQALEIAGSLD